MAVSKMIVDVVESVSGSIVAGLNIPSKAEFDSRATANKAIYGSSGQAKSRLGFERFIANSDWNQGNDFFITRSYPSNRPLLNAISLENCANSHPNRNSDTYFNIDGIAYRFDKTDIIPHDLPGDSTRTNNDTPGVPFGNPRMPSIETNGGSLSKAYVKGDMISLFEATPREVLPGATAAGNYAAWYNAAGDGTSSVALGVMTVAGGPNGYNQARLEVSLYKDVKTTLSFSYTFVNGGGGAHAYLYYADGSDYNIPLSGASGNITIDLGDKSVNSFLFYSYESVPNGGSITLNSFSLTQSGQCNLVALEDTPIGTSVNVRSGGVDNFASIDSFSHTDFMFMESWEEDVSITGMVYPLGNVQYAWGDVDGCTGIAAGIFAGANTYSLYGNWEPLGEVIGTGYIWANLTPAQKNSFAANPDNNLYAIDGKVYQARYRTRVVEGLGNAWLGIGDVGKVTNSGVYSNSVRNYLNLQGNVVTVTDLGVNNSRVALTGTTINKDSGTYGDRTLTQAVPIMTVQRRNPGIYDPSLNPQGCAMALSATSAKEWWEVSNINTVSDCFNPANIAVVNTSAATPLLAAISLTALATVVVTTETYHQTGTILSGVSGRPDGMYVDEVNVRDCHDERINAIGVTDYAGTLFQYFNDLDAIGNRGHQGEYAWRKLGAESTMTARATSTYGPDMLYNYRLCFATSEIIRSDIYAYGETGFRYRYAKSYVGSGIIVGSNGNTYITNSITYLNHSDGHTYIGTGGPNIAAELALFNRTFPVGTKLSYYVTEKRSNTYNGRMPICDIIGDPRNLQSRTKYIVATGVSQIVSLEMDDVILAANGNYYISLATRATIDLATDTMTTAANWVNMGANGAAGGYPSKWVNHGIVGLPLITNMNNGLVTLRRSRNGTAGGYHLNLNMSRMDRFSTYAALKVLVTTNGVTTELPLIANSYAILGVGNTIGYYCDINWSNFYFNLTGTGAHDPVIEANTFIQVFYEATTALTQDTGSRDTLAIDDGSIYNYYDASSHCELSNSILERYIRSNDANTKDNVGYRFKIDKYNLDTGHLYNLNILTNYWGSGIAHSANPNVLLQPTDGGVCKILPHLVRGPQGMALIALTYKELRYDSPVVNQDGTPTNTWGDDGKFDLYSVPAAVHNLVDLNGNDIIFGTKYIPLRRFIK